MPEIFDDIEQGSSEWFQVRLGIPTSSMFATVMAKGEGKTRRDYMLKLAGERLTGEPMGSYSNAAMERGHAMEDEARQFYAFVTDGEIRQVGFILEAGKYGCSPDALVGENGILEIKSAAPHVMVDLLLKDKFPPAHKAQCQGNLWVAGNREWIDICVYCPKLPPLIKRATRDEKYIREMAAEVARFNDELAVMVDRIQRYGQMEQAA